MKLSTGALRRTKLQHRHVAVLRSSAYHSADVCRRLVFESSIALGEL